MKPPVEPTKLITKVEYFKLAPCDQGYVCYMQAEQPGSELKPHQYNPYASGSLNHIAWNQGQFNAMLEAQDSEE